MEMEKIVRKKIELEKLTEMKRELSSNLEKEEIKVRAIEEEKERRDVSNYKNLQRILDKAELIDKAIKSGTWD
jgi:hypothetical protein